VRHEFVEFIPEHIEPGVIYVSLLYNLAVHKCASGCGHDVVTPLSPAEWSLTYDGQAVSLSPSIGNWNLPCRSHYWITKGRVRWAGAMTSRQIELVQEQDKRAREAEYAGGGSVDVSDDDVLKRPRLSLFARMARYITGR